MSQLFPNESFLVICNQCDFQILIQVGEDLTSIEDHSNYNIGHVVSAQINSVDFVMELLQETIPLEE